MLHMLGIPLKFDDTGILHKLNRCKQRVCTLSSEEISTVL